ncbi:MAG: GerMN domain-containing protein [Defluviitaleaceae bacterium]|nr:GerMN domain-containing protein [Defluviitaleaceae bacterium]
MKSKIKSFKKKIFVTLGLLVFLTAVAVGGWFYLQPNGYTVYIYQFDTRTNRLQPERRTVPEATVESMIQTTVLKLYETPQNSFLRRTIPADLAINEIVVRGNIMEISFPASYNDMQPYEEGLFKAALAQTMTNLPFIDIEGLIIFVDGEELQNSFEEPFGLLTQNRVLVNQNIMPMRVVSQTITLYFVDETATELLSESRTIERPDGVSVYQAVIEELINGPDSTGLIATIPSNARILDIRTEGGICTINFSEDFVAAFQGHQLLADLTLQSIVRSVTENVSTITSIQFLVESERRDTFNGVPYFDTLFTADEI